MRSFAVWIADCQFQREDAVEDYCCRAAIWADSFETVKARLTEHLDATGSKLIWLEEVLEATQYMSRHGQQVQLAPLARSVHAQNLVALGPATGLNGAGLPEAKASPLIVTSLDVVEPLGSQADVWPKCTVPSALSEPLFGQPEPSEAEIARYGDPESTPAQNTFAIIDAAKIKFGLSVLEDCGLPFRCLFRGDAADDLKDVAPYLVQLEADASFTRCLFTYNEKLPDDMATAHLWHKEPGIYIRSRASFDEIWSHFRKFTRIRDEKDDWLYFRFYEPSVLRNYLKRNASDQDRLQSFMMSEHHGIAFLCLERNASTLFQLAPHVTSISANAPRSISESDKKAWAEERWQAFQTKLLAHLSTDYPDLYAEYGPERLSAWSQQAREQGFRVEKANYNVVVAQIFCDQRKIRIGDLGQQIKEWPYLTELDRSYELLRALGLYGEAHD